MSLHYFAMVRYEPPCPECDEGVASDDDGQFTCLVCRGSGRAMERLVLYRDGKLYDEPGKASGSAKRAGHEPVVYKLDTDECEPVERHMSLSEKLEHAEAKYVFWGGRLEELQARAAGQLVLHKHDPKLTAADWEELLVVITNAMDLIERGIACPPILVERRQRLASLRERLSLKAHLDQMDADAVRLRAETDRLTADWAAGIGGLRKCLRVGEPDAIGQARTACGDVVPAPASTALLDEMACAGCEGALRRQAAAKPGAGAEP